MGEHADDALWDLLFGRGSEGDDETNVATIDCQHCGLPGLHWEKNTKNRWRLFDINGNIHTCSERPMSRHAEQLRKLQCLQNPDFGQKKR